MKAIVQDKYGSAEVLELREIDKPAIGEKDVLGRVHAAGVNIADWAIMSGLNAGDRVIVDNLLKVRPGVAVTEAPAAAAAPASGQAKAPEK